MPATLRKYFYCVGSLILSIGWHSIAESSLPVVYTGEGCVLGGKLYSYYSGGIQYNFTLPNGFNLTPYEGKKVLLDGILLPGDRFTPKNDSFASIGLCCYGEDSNCDKENESENTQPLHTPSLGNETKPTSPNGDSESQDDPAIYSNMNPKKVYNAGRSPTFTIDGPWLITSMTTYHWNNKKGAPPGTIALRSSDGSIFGPWSATSKPGQGGVPNTYWIVAPKIVLQPGRYDVIDSSPDTWSNNSATLGLGMTHITGFPQ